MTPEEYQRLVAKKYKMIKRGSDHDEYISKAASYRNPNYTSLPNTDNDESEDQAA